MILLIIIGVILVIASFSLGHSPTPLSKFSPTLRILGFLVIVLGIFSSMFTQIDAGKVGVTSLYGEVQPRILESGLHLINPLLEVTTFDIQTQNYTMSAVHGEGIPWAEQGAVRRDVARNGDRDDLVPRLVPSVTTQVATFKVIDALSLYDTRWSATWQPRQGTMQFACFPTTASK